MSVTHHLTDETIQDYAAGGLSMPMETLVACHLTVCNYCRCRADLADGIGGSLFDESEPAEVSLTASDLISKAEQLEESVVARDCGSVLSPAIKGVPRPLARFLPADLDSLDWRRIAPGIKRFKLNDQPRQEGAFQLLHLAPGVALSNHTHNDRELTYLVTGSYTDELGRFKVGDIADLDDRATHRPLVDSEEPCIALIATQSPVRFTGVFGKIMQPFVGI